MKIDFHVHGKLTKKADFDLGAFLTCVACAREGGLDAFVLSEHFNTKDFYGMYDRVDDCFEHHADAYSVKGVRVFTGMEVDVAGGGHIILVANLGGLIEARRALDNHTERGSFITLPRLLALAERYRCLTIGAHPFRSEHFLARQGDANLARLDALDLNATDIFTQGLDETRSQVRGLTERLHLRTVTGSDAHYPTQLGSVRTVVGRDCQTVDDLRQAIREDDLALEISPVLECKVFSARAAKTALKALHNV